jgi:3D (Asp-Asp-Asp) domain-containing protein
VCAVLLIRAVSAHAAWLPLAAYRITGYCPCVRCCEKSRGIAADGTYAPASAGRIVAAPGGIPFGTRIWIEATGIAAIPDRGATSQRRRVKIFFKMHDEARGRGVYRLRISRGCIYSVTVRATQPATDYTARVMPNCDSVAVPLKAAQIPWRPR